MCWVACDRLSKYADDLELEDRAEYWRLGAANIHEVISKRSWSAGSARSLPRWKGKLAGMPASFSCRGSGFLEPNDPRFLGTVAAIEGQLKHGDFVYRYIERDHLGYPQNAFLVCTFRYIEALAAMGGERRQEARALFEKVLAARNRHGLLAEDIDPHTLERWETSGAYCMAGIIDCAIALNR